jgi:hypothetical protein
MHAETNQREPSIFLTSVLVVAVLVLGGGAFAAIVAVFR